MCLACELTCKPTQPPRLDLPEVVFTIQNLSAKHKKRALGDDLVTNGDAKSAHILLNNYTCKNCDKQYISRNGLWKHNKTCITDNNAADIHEKELIMMLVKQNTHLIEQNAELVKINDSLSYLDNLLYKK